MKRQIRLAHPKYRPDIDGLRALAILSVVGFHVFPSLIPGGFIGVDIFFVISGYLISTIIFESLEQNRFNYTEFYIRRVKRIFPALIVVLFFTLLLGWFVLLSDEYLAFGYNWLAGASFVSNLYTMIYSGDYFSVDVIEMPLVHLWSLGVEEQFYIFWPLLLGMVWLRKINFLTVVIFVGCLSFFFNVYYVYQDQTLVYYSPLSRFWELMVGGVLAYISLHKSNYLKGNENCRAWLGISLIGLGFIFINGKSAFPGWYALLPTGGTFLLLSAGPNAWLNNKLFSQRIAVWFGLISYPLYLWHWPLLSFAWIDRYGMYDDGTYRIIKMGMIMISIGLAYLTYRFIELPVRRNNTNNKKMMLILGVGLVIPLILCFCIIRLNGIPSRIQYNKKDYPPPPGLNPSPICMSHHKLNAIVLGKEYIFCTEGKDLTKNTMILGDSHAATLYFAIRSDKQNSAMIGGSGCPPLLGLYFSHEENHPLLDKDFCPQIMKQAYQSITNDIKNVFLIAKWNNYDYYRDLQSPDLPAETALYDGLKRNISKLLQQGKNVFLVLQVPELSFSPKQCLILRPIDHLFNKKPKECILSRQEVEKNQAKFRAIVSRITHEIHSNQFVVLDPLDILCDPQSCYPIRGGVILYRDKDHLNKQGSEYLWTRLKARYLQTKSEQMPSF